MKYVIFGNKSEFLTKDGPWYGKKDSSKPFRYPKCKNLGLQVGKKWWNK